VKSNRLFIMSSSETGVGMGNLLKFTSSEIRSLKRGGPEEGGYEIVRESDGETFLGFDLMVLESTEHTTVIDELDLSVVPDLSLLLRDDLPFLKQQ
jgi:hypothetical protein